MDKAQVDLIRCSVALASLLTRAQDLTAQLQGRSAKRVEWIGAYAFEWAWPRCAQSIWTCPLPRRGDEAA